MEQMNPKNNLRAYYTTVTVTGGGVKVTVVWGNVAVQSETVTRLIVGTVTVAVRGGNVTGGRVTVAAGRVTVGGVTVTGGGVTGGRVSVTVTVDGTGGRGTAGLALANAIQARRWTSDSFILAL